MTARMLIHLRKTLALRQQKTYNAALAQLDRAHPAKPSVEPAGTIRAHRRVDTESTLVDDLTPTQQKTTEIAAVLLVKSHGLS